MNKCKCPLFLINANAHLQTSRLCTSQDERKPLGTKKILRIIHDCQFSAHS